MVGERLLVPPCHLLAECIPMDELRQSELSGDPCMVPMEHKTINIIESMEVAPAGLLYDPCRFD